jgi:deoxyribose-phosphate aldolase
VAQEFYVQDINRLIDHTTLGAEDDAQKIKELCSQARGFGFRAVFVQPCRVALAVDLLSDTDIRIGTVAGFPFGANLPALKAREAAAAVDLGAQEIDMVINVGWIKDGRWDDVKDDIAGVVEACRAVGRATVVKVIIETGLLTDDEKRLAALAVKDAGAGFVKTSTGYLGEGANVDDVALLREAVGPEFGVKASGGIRTLAQLEALVIAGASVIGTSAGLAIMAEAEARG